MYEKTVRVQGEPASIFQRLLNTLVANRYEIQTQIPHTNISAKRGSKVSSALLEGTTGGYRELNIAIAPSGDEFELQFRFDFPSWAMTLQSAKKDCNALVEQFVKMPLPEVPAPNAETRCPSCGEAVREGAKFCDNCGTPM